ncbi:hypothetical protein COJ96_02175 [Bacillus sp. AFS073361]|uniref:GGDEF domain-containing protein n=1 Tax=Bacillus sp. AFS073361 TaxID=2033511 RepID=UPI000BF6C830|nr:GGDEF domain-containing protein [Bacillus sp. AFS073361]PFP30792.1 hypothetical protein COJ96_02175 [Bacillus sp. AFS073361]
MLTSNDETNSYLKLKRTIYLTIIPILNVSTLLQLKFSPYLDQYIKVTLPLQIIFLTAAWIFVYKNMYVRTFEICFLCFFGIFHINRVIELANQLVQNSIVLYIFWAPLFIIFSFMVLDRKKALIFSLMIFFITLVIVMPDMFDTVKAKSVLTHLFFSHLIYIVVVYFFQTLVTYYHEANLLKQIAFEDTLTKIPNRRMLDKWLENEIQLSETNHSSFSVIYFDIDHFKKVNDKHGHEVGDEVLKEFAAIVKENVPNNSYLGRWGGEEFLIVAPNHSTKEATELAERLRDIIKDHFFPEVGSITASFGVSTFTANDQPRTIIWRADVGLYEAKLSGRNSVKVHLA